MRKDDREGPSVKNWRSPASASYSFENWAECTWRLLCKRPPAMSQRRPWVLDVFTTLLDSELLSPPCVPNEPLQCVFKINSLFSASNLHWPLSLGYSLFNDQGASCTPDTVFLKGKEKTLGARNGDRQWLFVRAGQGLCNDYRRACVAARTVEVAKWGTRSCIDLLITAVLCNLKQA